MYLNLDAHIFDFFTVFIPQIWFPRLRFASDGIVDRFQVSEKLELFVYSYTKQQEDRAAN